MGGRDVKCSLLCAAVFAGAFIAADETAAVEIAIDDTDIELVGPAGYCPLELVPFARVTGRVLRPDGRPAADAMVGAPLLWDQGQGERWNTTRTDEGGRFSILAGRLGMESRLEAFSSRWGLGQAKLNVATRDNRPHATLELKPNLP